MIVHPVLGNPESFSKSISGVTYVSGAHEIGWSVSNRWRAVTQSSKKLRVIRMSRVPDRHQRLDKALRWLKEV